MAQTYTLEEAADKLNLSVEEFKRRIRTEWTQVRSFRDGATLRFRANEIDELARSYGLGSSDELPVPEADYPAASAPTAQDAPLKLDDSDETFTITPDAKTGQSSTKLKKDSGARLNKPAPKADDEESILTEEFDVPADGSGKLSGKSGKLSSTQLKGGDSGKQKAPGSSGKLKPAAKPDSSSEFELSLDPDSDEFELSLAPDSSEEVSLGDMPADAGAAAKSGNSGINLNRPADSGVSLEKKKPAKKSDDEEIDFELSLDAPGSGTSSKKLSSGTLKQDSDSEFELTLEEPSDLATAGGEGDKKGDIFEATDFDIPALEDDSASEAVSLDEADTDLESSDFDLALDEADAVAEDDESASEVVTLDEDDAPRKKKKSKAKKRAADDDDDDEDLDDDDDAASALRGVRRGEDEDEEEEEGAVAGRAVGAPAAWGPIPAIFMFPTVLVMFLGAIMAFELLHSTWGYQQANQPTTPLVNFFANSAGLKEAK